MDIILKIPLASRLAVDATFKSSPGQFYQVIIIIISVIWIVNIPTAPNSERVHWRRWHWCLGAIVLCFDASENSPRLCSCLQGDIGGEMIECSLKNNDQIIIGVSASWMPVPGQYPSHGRLWGFTTRILLWYFFCTFVLRLACEKNGRWPFPHIASKDVRFILIRYLSMMMALHVIYIT